MSQVLLPKLGIKRTLYSIMRIFRPNCRVFLRHHLKLDFFVFCLFVFLSFCLQCRLSVRWAVEWKRRWWPMSRGPHPCHIMQHWGSDKLREKRKRRKFKFTLLFLFLILWDGGSWDALKLFLVSIGLTRLTHIIQYIQGGCYKWRRSKEIRYSYKYYTFLSR